MFTIYERSLIDASGVISGIGSGALSAATPCDAWNLRALLTHMVGQNDGFTAAVVNGDAPASAYERPELSEAETHGEWHRSSRELLQAFGKADLDGHLHVAGMGMLAVRTALRMIILDTIVHTWDVSAALGIVYRPEEELARFSRDFAREIASLPPELTGTYFAPPLDMPSTGEGARSREGDAPWTEALRLVGRPCDHTGRWLGPHPTPR
jgi:uncharacterized protein (TIGR03086 family)